MYLKDRGQLLVYSVIDPIVKILIKINVSPNAITLFGFALNILAAGVLIWGAECGERLDHRYVGIFGAIILFAGLMDMLDGRLAREGNMSSKYGALFDSVIDRFSELYMFFGICYYLISHDYFFGSIFTFIALIGSIMVSYTRARAEGLGVNNSVGFFQRPERILIVGLSAIVCGVGSMYIDPDFIINVDWFPMPLFETITLLTFPIFVLAIGANITAIRRLLNAKTQLERSDSESISKG